MFLQLFRWLGWRLDFMAIGVVTATGIFILILQNVVPPSLGGLVLSYALQMAGVFQWSGKFHSQKKKDIYLFSEYEVF
jgi:hypothetical protein